MFPGATDCPKCGYVVGEAVVESGWSSFRYFLGSILLLAGYGTLIFFILFLIFLFPKGTSSGSFLGLMLFGPPLAGAIVISIILGHLIKPKKKSRDESI